MKEDSKPLIVTIQCFTYNHENYIRQCLDGFVMQKTNFRFEAIVHDDASTDGTASIIHEYAEKYPDIIKPIYETENQYSKRDGSLTRIMDEHTHGKYIAICEGDDYWIDPLKLQMQVDYMEKNEKCVLTHTAFSYIEDGVSAKVNENLSIDFNLKLIEQNVDLRPYILDGNQYLVQTMTVVMKSSAYFLAKNMLKEFEGKFLLGDTPLWISLLSIGDIHFFKEKTSCYRLHPNSACHQLLVKSRLRFLLSCSEMRVLVAAKFNLPYNYKEKFRRQYNNILTKYLWFDPDYKPFVISNDGSFPEKILHKILRTRFVALFAKKMYLIIRN